MGSQMKNGDHSGRASLLSARADKIKGLTNDVEMWKVIRDTWHPKDNPGGIVSLGMAENWLMRKSVTDHIKNNFDPPDNAFTYGDGTTGSQRVKEAVAGFVNSNFSPFNEVRPEHITMTNGTSAALEHISWAFADAGDHLLLGRPYYGNYGPDFTWRFDANLLKVAFNDDDDRFTAQVAVQAYENALLGARENKTKVTGLIVCHPHNPLGRCYPREMLIELMKFCQRHELHFICDEIYALSTWENTVDKDTPSVPFESALSINLQGVIDPNRVHVIWGMSKDFGSNGIRVGALISQANVALHQSLVATGMYTFMSSLSDHVTVKMLEDEDWLKWYVPENQRRISAAFTRIARWAKNNNITYAKGANAGFFMWADLGTKYREKHPGPSEDVDEAVKKALRSQKVFLASGKDFGAEKDGWFRIVFTVSDYYINEGLKRIIAALS